MEQQKAVTLYPGIEYVRDQFKHRRQTRKSRREPIPEKLWQEAAKLTRLYSINNISKTLRLNYTDLKSHVYGRFCGQVKAQKPSAFIKLDCGHPLFESECIVEMKDAKGSKTRMCFKGKADFRKNWCCVLNYELAVSN
ncbi:MAG: hypothetical protein JRD05_13055 [Deltaproteobacteria bacterium]|nr:hypothetical protein [Deltaproteobacteria bacterium]